MNSSLSSSQKTGKEGFAFLLRPLVWMYQRLFGPPVVLDLDDTTDKFNAYENDENRLIRSSNEEAIRSLNANLPLKPKERIDHLVSFFVVMEENPFNNDHDQKKLSKFLALVSKEERKKWKRKR